ncbi:hypothetical protein QAD02_006713 [Eretmocerus hayati]|uniref:Uncharacterized protein n=1 Tax=Eretmocerus hayati TaxID=131215 RepID=A0ACC2N2V6_9HYME|nr:hypothetical protein QAD02_006713 [Eretmocerus hayati]
MTDQIDVRPEERAALIRAGITDPMQQVLRCNKSWRWRCIIVSILMLTLQMTKLMLMAEADMDCMDSWSYGPLQLATPRATRILNQDVRWKMVKMLTSAVDLPSSS